MPLWRDEYKSAMKSEKRTLEIAAEFLTYLKDEQPKFLDKSGWRGKLIEWAMRDESFKVQLLRFIDVLPALKTDEMVIRIFKEYLHEVATAPSLLRQSAEAFVRGMPARIAAPAIRASVRSFAREFIVGEDSTDALPFLESLRKDGAAVTVDLLGEAVVSDVEAQIYARRYLDLCDFLVPNFSLVLQHPSTSRDRLDISLKVSSFFSQMEPLNWEGSINQTSLSLRPLLEKSGEQGVSVTFDMEQYYYKDLIIAIFKRTLTELKNSLSAGIALQAYLKDTKNDLVGLLRWAKENRQRIGIRLVKGAYWDYEAAINRQKGWPVPVFLEKDETDRNFEELTKMLLENTEFVYPAIATHNVRSICVTLALAEKLRLSPEDYEFQALYGMDGPLRRALKRMSVKTPVRVYCPIGELIPGMAYLVRRILENTANESMFRKTFAEKRTLEDLLRRPERTGVTVAVAAEQFRNEPVTDFSKADNRQRIKEALSSIKSDFGRKYPLFIGNEEILTTRETLSTNPAQADEIIGRISYASKAHADLAITRAKEAFARWSATTPEQRADYLFRAASEMRRRKFALTALETYEVGKTIPEADSDVAEAIDYLEYYGRQILVLGKPKRLGQYPGEINDYVYEPKGIGAVISPWNFPMAIPVGMASAAIVAGNCMILKPSGLSAVAAWQMMDIFRVAGLPPGVLQYLPGSGADVGQYLVSHPDISMIAFTGSKETGLHIIDLAGKPQPGQVHVKKVVAEMGGKNAIIIDETADLDEAVKCVLESALGYQGQKCSACSRVIVLQEVYVAFCERLKEAMKSVEIGPPDDPSVYMGPLVDKEAYSKVQGYIAKGKKEGKPILIREAARGGLYVGPVLFEVSPDASIAREEIFGPVVSLLKAADIEAAISIANGSEYALTGGIFSRSPMNIDTVRRSFRVGNLYINRKITGALVGRQPFGGFSLSGIGSKAGGPDYLVQFMNPRTISENVMRKGFVPQPQK